jgi:hypothetical protein
MTSIVFSLNIATVLTAFGAAAFWFLSARGKVPGMIAYWNGTPPDDPFYRAFVVSVKMNKWAAVLSGTSAVMFAISLCLQAATRNP